jgi:hypothetical protein
MFNWVLAPTPTAVSTKDQFGLLLSQRVELVRDVGLAGDFCHLRAHELFHMPETVRRAFEHDSKVVIRLARPCIEKPPKAA